ncbi:hypothetical protein OG218_21655 [Kineococcus sp. NBC_00420]|uniref:hypothetical protein n=1 Tax=Kineococcus sp. NBC_00420 TaxID=2903564 RepID=UPI002E1CBDF6
MQNPTRKNLTRRTILAGIATTTAGLAAPAAQAADRGFPWADRAGSAWRAST